MLRHASDAALLLFLAPSCSLRLPIALRICVQHPRSAHKALAQLAAALLRCNTFCCSVQHINTLYSDVDNDDGAASLKVNNVSESYPEKNIIDNILPCSTHLTFHRCTPSQFSFFQKGENSSHSYERGFCVLVETTGRGKSMEMSVVVVVVGAVVGRQWEVHWAASGQLSSVNPTKTTTSLSQPHAHLLWAHFP